MCAYTNVQVFSENGIFVTNKINVFHTRAISAKKDAHTQMYSAAHK